METFSSKVNEDWGGTENRKLISSYLFTLGSDFLVLWASKRQATNALSTTEAEYVAARSAAQEAVWLGLLLTRLRLQRKQTNN